ncbi:hypothetical protein ACWCYZ_42055 [Streptomyces virginiae]
MFGRKKKTSATDAVMWQAIADARRSLGGVGVEDVRRHARTHYGVELDYMTVFCALRDGREG